jgi:TRAP-type C4-dicarboxylate transport system substrate-binding protein
MALKRGVSDAMANSIVNGYFQKTHEVAPLVTQIEMSYSAILFCINLKTWKKLPKDVQDVMTSIGKKKSAYCLAAAKGWQQKFTGEMIKEGATVKPISPEERAKIIAVARPVWEKWAEKHGKDAKRLMELNERK